MEISEETQTVEVAVSPAPDYVVRADLDYLIARSNTLESQCQKLQETLESLLAKPEPTPVETNVTLVVENPTTEPTGLQEAEAEAIAEAIVETAMETEASEMTEAEAEASELASIVDDSSDTSETVQTVEVEVEPPATTTARKPGLIRTLLFGKSRK